MLRTRTHAYVQFGNGHWVCFDLASDPTWRTTTTDPATGPHPLPPTHPQSPPQDTHTPADEVSGLRLSRRLLAVGCSRPD